LKPHVEALLAVICTRNHGAQYKYSTIMRNRDRRYSALAASAHSTKPAALLYGALDAEMKFALSHARPEELRHISEWRARCLFEIHDKMKTKFEKALTHAIKNEKSSLDMKSRIIEQLMTFGNIAMVEIMSPAKVWYQWVVSRNCKNNEQCKRCASVIHFPGALPPIPSREGCRCFAAPVIAV
jgi:hypothetical protein